jgi:hypothetical protein
VELASCKNSQPGPMGCPPALPPTPDTHHYQEVRPQHGHHGNSLMVDIIKAASIVDGILTRSVVDKTRGLTTSKVIKRFFKIVCFRFFTDVSTKNQNYLFLKQNLLPNQKFSFQISTYLVQNQVLFSFQILFPLFKKILENIKTFWFCFKLFRLNGEVPLLF